MEHVHTEIIELKLLAIAHLCVALEKAGGPEKDGNLFENLIDFEKDILKQFGLPLNPYYLNLVLFDTIPDKIEIKKRIDQLHKEAAEYLTASAKSDLQILQEAQATNGDPFSVLPELKITPHVYTIFLINKMLIEKQEKPEAILKALKIATSEREILDALGKYVDSENDDEKYELFTFAIDKNVPYLKEFVVQ